MRSSKRPSKADLASHVPAETNDDNDEHGEQSDADDVEEMDPLRPATANISEEEAAHILGDEQGEKNPYLATGTLKSAIHRCQLPLLAIDQDSTRPNYVSGFMHFKAWACATLAPGKNNGVPVEEQVINEDEVGREIGKDLGKGWRAALLNEEHLHGPWTSKWRLRAYLLLQLLLPPNTATAATAATATATVATAAPTYYTAMASIRVLVFDHEGRPVQFDMWLYDMQLYLLSDSKDSVLLFDLATGAATAPPATADSSNRSQWLTRDAAARLAICNHLPLAECAYFGQHRTAHALYDAVVARYSSPATVALGRLLLPYLFPELSAFATVEDLVSHLRASVALYCDAVPAEFLDRNPPPMDHFLSLDPTSLTVDLLEQHLLAAETSAVAVGAAHGTPRPHFFEGCPPSPLAPSYASAAATDVAVPEDVEAASASAKCRNSKGKGGQGGGGGNGGGGGGSGSGWGGSSGGGGGGGTVGGSAGSGGGSRGSGGSGGSRGGGTGSSGTDARRAGSGDCYRCVPPDPGIAAATLGASESGTLPGTAPAEALHTFTLESGASRCFFRDSTTLTPFRAPVLVRLADPSEGPVVARSSTILPCPAVPSGSLSGLHLLSFSTNLVSTAALQGAMVTTTTPGGQRVSIFTCTWTGRHLVTSGSRLLLVSPPLAPDSSVAPLSWSPLPTSPLRHALSSSCLWPPQVSSSPTALACLALPPVRRGAAARRSSLLLVSPDDCSPADSPHGRSVSSSASGSAKTFTLPDSPQQNGIAERRIGLVMEVARTSMIHAAAPHFLWPFAVQYAAHQLNLWPRVSLPETSSTLRLTGKVGDTSLFWVWGSRAFVRDTSADKLSPCAIPCVFLGFVPDAPGWQFYHPTSRRVFPSQDVTFDESVPFYRLFPYRSAPPPPSPLFLALGPPPVDPLPSVVSPLPLLAPPESSLHEVPDPESDRARAVNHAVSHLLATAVTDPSFESAAASALIDKLLDFATAYCPDYATALVAESASASPPSVGGECALGTDVLEDRQEDFECLEAAVPRFASMLFSPKGDPDALDIPTPRSYAEAITGPYSSQWQAPMDAEMASWM
ncbi:unnamed protein product [Closterium sp. NIES-53]